MISEGTFRIFTIKAIIGLSFIITSNYYLYSRNFYFFFVDKVLIQSLILFFFVLLSVILYSKFLNYLIKIDLKKIFLFFFYFFYAWIIVQTLQTLFVASNYTTLSQFLSKVFNITVSGEYALYKRIFLYIFPYILFFTVLFFIKIEKLKKYLDFFVIFGYIFFALSIYDLSFKISYTETLNNFKNHFKPKNIDLKNTRKVYWIVLDAFDPEIAFQNNKINFLENFNKIHNSSFTHHNLFPPAKDTINSMPAQLMGVPVRDSRFNNKKIEIKTTDNKWMIFENKNTLFGKLDKLNLSYSIMSSTIPYCSFLKITKNCLEPDNSPLKGIFFSFPIFSKIKLALKLYKKKVDNYLDINQINKINVNEYLNKIKDTDGTNIVKFNNIKKILKLNNNLTFIHIMTPHLSARYGYTFSRYHSENIFDVDVEGDLNLYTLNLKLSDLIIGKFLSLLDVERKKDAMIILSSDHWFRLRDDKKPYPTLFIAKIFDDDHKVENYNKNTSIYVPELIIDYLNNEISTHNEINFFFNDSNRKFEKTFMK